MIRQNLHTHTQFDDAKSTAAEMAEAALAAGFTGLGFSGHSPLPYENDWSMVPADVPRYRAEIARLRDACAGRLAVWCGLEWDVISPLSPQGFDYVIGSLHHIAMPGACPSVDDSGEATDRYLADEFGGDPDRAAEAYYAQYAALAAEPCVSIVGHFDLLTKFDEQRRRFFPDSPRYRAAAEAAMEKLVQAGKIFEINSGAIFRGFRKTPYPSEELLSRLHAMGGEILFSSDCHAAPALTCGLAASEALAVRCGFRQCREFDGRDFVPRAI